MTIQYVLCIFFFPNNYWDLAQPCPENLCLHLFLHFLYVILKSHWLLLPTLSTLYRCAIAALSWNEVNFLIQDQILIFNVRGGSGLCRASTEKVIFQDFHGNLIIFDYRIRSIKQRNFLKLTVYNRIYNDQLILWRQSLLNHKMWVMNLQADYI